MSFEPTQQDRRNRWLVLLAALIAILPLLLHGCSCGHDFDFHLLNWIEVASQLSHGGLHPHWAFTPAFNAGEPRFVFYPPVSWYLGAGLGMVLSHLPGISEAAAWNAAPILYTWISLAAAGLAFYRLAREFAAPNAALLAAALYIANPYMMFTAYERTAYAELLAAAWMPLLFLAILRKRVTVAGIAIPLALLWLTNAPAAVMGSDSLAALAGLRMIRTARRKSDASSFSLEGSATTRTGTWKLALQTAAGTALGFGLAAFYILPAAYERRFVQIAMVIVPGLRIQDNFLFEHTTGPDAPAHDLVLHTASMVAVLMLAATAVVLGAYLARRAGANPQDRVPAAPLAVLAIGIVFLLTPLSLVVWKHLPQAGFLQFPWRLLAVLAVILALAFAGLLSSIDRLLDRLPMGSSRLGSLRLGSRITAVLAVGLVAAITFPAYRIFGQHCFVEDQPTTRLILFHSNAGTDATDEYTPLRADNNALTASGPPYWLADSAQAPAPRTAMPGVTPARLTVTASHAEELILNLRNYPAWRIDVNGRVESRRVQRKDGLVALPVLAGVSTVAIHYAETADQTIGDGISLLALLLLLLIFYADRRRKRVSLR